MLDPNEGRIPTHVSREFFEHFSERYDEMEEDRNWLRERRDAAEALFNRVLDKPEGEPLGLELRAAILKWLVESV
jgi:hypothetical protein